MINSLRRVIYAARDAAKWARPFFSNKKNYLFFSLLISFAFSVNGQTIEGIIHPESAFTTRDGRIFVSEIGKVGEKGDGKIIEIFTKWCVAVIILDSTIDFIIKSVARRTKINYFFGDERVEMIHIYRDY